MKYFILHYGEVALKKGNRTFFERALQKNILSKLQPIGPLNVRTLQGRILLEFAATPNPEAVTAALKKIFGLVNFIPCEKTEATLESLKQDLGQRLETLKFSSFAVRAKKGTKNFPVSSQYVNEEIGRFVKERTSAKVDLENPEKTIHIEMFSDALFYGFEKIEGLGGLPAGIGGKAVSLLSGGIDSPVASFRIMKRGCECLFIHFHSAPFTSEESLDKVLELAEKLAHYQNNGLLFCVPFGEIQRQIIAKTPDVYRVLLYRRMMFRIAEAIAKEYRAQALVTGESLSQVASQTLSNLRTIGACINLPIFRPLIGMDKVEIVKEARKIGTYEISIKPHEDCCSFMLPKHPKTSSFPDLLETIEKHLEVDALVQKGVKELKIYELGGKNA